MELPECWLRRILQTGIRCEVKVTDLGFGELYPASDLYWKESFLMEEQEDGHGTGNDL